MNTQVLMFVILVAVFSYTVVDCKSIHKDDTDPQKNLGLSVLKLSLTQENINRGVSIQINGKSNTRKGRLINEIVTPTMAKLKQRKNGQNNLRKSMRGKRADLMQDRKMSKFLSKLHKSLATRNNQNERALNMALMATKNSIITPETRSRRSVPVEKQPNDEQVADVKQLIENGPSDLNGAADANLDNGDDENVQSKIHLHRKSQQMFRDLEQKKQLQFINSAGNKDYAFDTTDTDHFKDDDDLLSQYYHKSRSTAFSDYDTINHLMQSSNDLYGHNENYVKRLHYGDAERFLNDENNGHVDDDSEYYDEY